MTGSIGWPVRGRRLLAAVRWGGAVTSALALAALATIGPPGPARAAATGDSYNQMTGQGLTASTITVPWTSGLLDSNNQPITTNTTNELAPNSDRGSGTGSLSFMYNDFKKLQVTVSQTKNITHQAIIVTWTGGVQTSVTTTAQQNFLQMMECYGDSNTGPSPDDCQFGSPNMLGGGGGLTPTNPQIGTRTGDRCPDPSIPNSRFWGGAAKDAGCDPNEPGSGSTPLDCWPNAPAGLGCPDGNFTVPFLPVDGQSPPIYDNRQLAQYFTQFDTNEVQEAATSSAGTGQQQFQALTKIQAQGLGCGEPDNGQPRGCWLVIVPRGTFEPNQFQATSGVGPDSYLYTSPLSAANWAQRIQIHLDYAPLQVSCPENTPTVSIDGTQVLIHAITSWQLALNQASNCARLYQFGEAFETQTTQDLSTANVGLGFTTIPIGAEDTRYPGEPPPPQLPPLIYAPVAVTALGLGFNISIGSSGFVTTPVKLTPRLLAKALTQAYRSDLPDYGGSGAANAPGPLWSRKNPGNITQDPAFKKINLPTQIPTYALSAAPIAPLTTLDHSAVNQQLWQWIQADPGTSSWLDGATDPKDPVTADHDYLKYHLGKPPAVDNYPQLYTGAMSCNAFRPDCGPNGSATLNTQDLLPQFLDYDTAAATALAANDKSETLSSWSNAVVDPNTGTSGWWSPSGVEPPGSAFMWTVASLPDIANYGLIPADLCDPSGSSCVGPSVASVTKTLNSATADPQGLLQINPARVPAGGYPLVDVVYAAVATNQNAVGLTADADLIQYAVGQGQTVGSALGDLPPGYLPLPASLQGKAQAVVAQLRALAHPSPSHSPAPTHSRVPAQSPPAGTTSTQSPPSTGTNATPGPVVGAQATPIHTSGGTSGSPTQQGPVIVPPTAELAGGTTPTQQVGTIRWALVAVLIIGAAGALGGTLLRSARMPRRRQGGRA